jgi:Nup133 N terminal like
MMSSSPFQSPLPPSSQNPSSSATPGATNNSSNKSIAQVLQDYWKDDFSPLQAAGRIILQALRDDEGSQGADLYRRIGSTGPGAHAYFGAAHGLEYSHNVPLSRFLLEQRMTAKYQSLLGLLPLAQLAWMSVDDQLYLWSIGQNQETYNGNSPLCSFQVTIGHSIVSVGLVRPVPGENVICTDKQRECVR